MSSILRQVTTEGGPSVSMPRLLLGTNSSTGLPISNMSTLCTSLYLAHSYCKEQLYPPGGLAPRLDVLRVQTGSFWIEVAEAANSVRPHLLSGASLVVLGVAIKKGPELVLEWLALPERVKLEKLRSRTEAMVLEGRLRSILNEIETVTAADRQAIEAAKQKALTGRPAASNEPGGDTAAVEKKQVSDYEFFELHVNLVREQFGDDGPDVTINLNGQRFEI